MTATSVYIANDPAIVTDVERWLGQPLDYIQLHGGVANWSDWLTSLGWLADLFAEVETDKMWSVGLMPWGASLADASKGEYDSKYLALAQQFVAKFPEGPIYIRLGWEMNTDGWNPWSSIGHEGDYAGAFRHFVDTFRSVSDRFTFEWTPNINTGVDPALFYPGDDYVDVIGVDFYYNIRWDPQDPVEAWNYFVNQPYGLQWQQDFAAAHGKPTAIGEWGINSDTAGPFIALAAKWFEDHDMLYQNYWASNAAFSGDLAHGQYPHAAAAFLEAFGADTSVPPESWRLFTSDGFAGEIGGGGLLFGTSEFQEISLLGQQGHIRFDPSFNRGGDVIRLAGEAADYSVGLTGSSAILQNGLTVLTIPLGTKGLSLDFDDGVRMLRFDTLSGSAMIGTQGVTATPVAIAAAAQDTILPDDTDPAAIARLMMSPGGHVTLGGGFQLFGTAASEKITYRSGDIVLDPSFNRGGDTLVLPHAADDYTARLSGSAIVLASADGQITIPVGTAGMKLDFDGDQRMLIYSTVSRSAMIDDHVVTSDATVFG